jgi:hypothetical protein
VTCVQTLFRLLTMKWSNRTAQGFNPGLADIDRCPESGTRRFWARLVVDGPKCLKPNSVATFRAHFGQSIPRAEALGCFVGPFHGRESSRFSSELLTLARLGTQCSPRLAPLWSLRTIQSNRHSSLAQQLERQGTTASSNSRVRLPQCLAWFLLGLS